MLFATNGGRGNAASVPVCGIDREASPPGADLQQMVLRREPQLAANAVEFLQLRLLEWVFPFQEIGAGVGQRRIEKQLVELIAQIVMMMNVPATAAQSISAHAVLNDVGNAAQQRK